MRPMTLIEGHHPDVPNLKLGKAPAKSDARTPPLMALISQAKITVPTSKFRADKIAESYWGMLGNDQYGNCEWASMAHSYKLQDYVEKDEVDPENITEQIVVDAYLKYTDGQDTGSVLLDCLNLRLTQPWANFGGKCIDAFAGLSLGSQLQQSVEGSVYVCGSALLGVGLPLALQKTPYDWTVTIPTNWRHDPNWQPGSWGGHAVCGLDFDSTGVWIITWGKRVKVSWAMLKFIMDEGYAYTTPYWRNRKGNSPQGFTPAQVQAWIHQHQIAA